jgi:hypothetical protein
MEMKMSLNYEEFMMKQTEWRGEVKTTLKNINNDIEEIKMDIKEIKMNNRKRDVRTAEIAGGVAVLIMLGGFLIQSGIG